VRDKRWWHNWLGRNAPAVPLIRLPDFASSDEEAEERFVTTRGRDPFPDIAPALLNTADLVDYVAATGMLHPFDVDPANPSVRLKPASCGIPLVGTVLWWETEGESTLRRELDLKPGDKLALKRNSIVYVTLEPMLRMPDYIAARFNLTIRDIYRGILVGTGPLVDPGFTGRLSLPLHNLTFNDYELTGGEPIVWMEFTKLSYNDRWARGTRQARRGEYVEFPDRKRDRRTVHDYVKYASPDPVTSSIPPLVGKAQESARKAERASRRQLGVSGLAALGVIVGIGAIVFAGFQLVDGVDGRQRDLTRQVTTLEQQVKTLQAGRGP
jgi:deoxycytidine triphosphate deaminase